MSVSRALQLKFHSALRIGDLIWSELKRGRVKSAASYTGKAIVNFTGNRVPWLARRMTPPHFEETEAFDRQYGVDTTRLVPVSAMEVKGKNAAFGSFYLASSPKFFHEVLTGLPDLAFEDFTFVDCGSGKGLTLLLASDYPFKKIVGVEFGADLDRIAKRNIDIYEDKNPAQRCRDLEAVCADATEWPPPEGPTLFYLYNPFEEPVMNGFLDQLERSLQEKPREVYIIYVEPRYAETIRKRPFLEPIGGYSRNPRQSFIVFKGSG